MNDEELRDELADIARRLTEAVEALEARLNEQGDDSV